MVNAAETFGIDPAMGHPERALALGYAPWAARDGVAALFALDATLARIVRSTREPIVAQMRLTWWHAALAALDDTPRSAHPILRALQHGGGSGARLATMIDGWEALLDSDSEALAVHAAKRGALLFASVAALADSGDATAAAGEGWALADIALTAPDAARAMAARAAAMPLLEAARRQRWSRNGRMLGALAHVARMDLDARHAPGAPQRVARLLLHRLSGR